MILDVWLEGRMTPVGRLMRDEAGALSFLYADDVRQGYALSLSLPLQKGAFSDAQCRGFFSNLFFEGPQLQRVLASFKLDRNDIAGLLYYLGADCPGAVSVTPEGSGPAKMPGSFPEHYRELKATEIDEIVLSLHLHKRLPEAFRDPSPVAGVQGKLAVVYFDGRYFLPLPGSRAPTTHILKVSPSDDRLITRHEVQLLHIAKACHISIAECEAKTFKIDGNIIHSILSTRFDRRFDPVDGAGQIDRVHTEDFCQALGLAPTLKYERDSINAAHRFSATGIGRIAELSSVPSQFALEALRHCIFNLLVGNTDNHGKNGSVIHAGGGTALAPLYDVVPVIMDSNVNHRFSFKHGAADYAEDLSEENLLSMVVDLGAGRRLDRRIKNIIQKLIFSVTNHAALVAEDDLERAIYAQMRVIERALGWEFGLPPKDPFPRLVRNGLDDHGWG